MAPPAFSADDIDPSTGLATTTVVRPLRDAPATPQPPQFGPLPPPAAAKPHIALILPIASTALGPVADAVRQGFVAAAEAGSNKTAPPVVLMNVNDDGPAMLEACRKAHSMGAVLVVAGLTRDGASAIAKSDCPRVPVLTLNQTHGANDAVTGEAPVNLYSISLSLEQEARQAALLAVADGWHSAIVIGTASPISKRVQEAFEKEWARAAGEIGGRVTYSGNSEEAPLVKDRIASLRGGDVVFLALGQAAARAVRPYVSGMLPVYATSMSIDPRAEPTVNVDLQGMRYMDMPWFVQPDHPAVMIYPAPHAPMSVDQERLYALGIDAYRLAAVMLQSDAKKISLDGVTGRITLEGGQFARTLTAAEVDGGRVVPIKHP
ncbi:Penicillin-binding protein activator LpoA [Usitatibacter palustris]|uniref:Penicillin-binding protein activator LpoA n=2 Tax=Usitatibacter palustris TaxID=2732487 RepID=A0A6M4H3G2_9PROT|nr:Penicillin-binding protein activator LpoA [Usitatibacter palustris]